VGEESQEEEMKEGRKQKDAIILDGFNFDKLLGMKKGELKEAGKQARKEKKLAKRAQEAAKKEALVETPAETPSKEELEKFVAGLEGEDDEKSAYQMLQDMRWVYRKVAGRKKLHNLMKEDDKQFLFMVKELMKIEAQLLSAQIRSKEDPQGQQQQTVFVVLKGLEEPPVVVAGDGAIDLKQVSAALTPEGKEYDS